MKPPCWADKQGWCAPQDECHDKDNSDKPDDSGSLALGAEDKNPELENGATF